MIFKHTYILTAQRDSLHIFRYALNRKNRNDIRNTNGKKFLERYALPVDSELDLIDFIPTAINFRSYLHETDLINDIEHILGINYHIQQNAIHIQNNDVIIPAFMASTSVRTLADLHFYLKHIAQKGDLLMIDEPELNLHPESQIKIARLLVKLVNAGIKVWITTHSDYIVKELNNCLMLSREFEGKAELMEELGYKADETLTQDDLRVYIADNGTVERVEYDEYGMLKSSFDEAMRQQNYNADTISRKISRSL